VLLYLRRAGAEAAVASQAAAAPAAGASARLLLVEDDAIGRENAAEYLRENGYAVLEAEDGPAAIKCFDEQPEFDLLITDVGLPNGINGRHLADLLRERAPVIPVLFITGYAGAARLDGLAPGMKILTKPFPLPALAAQVETLLSKAKQTAP
jgi:CheY-like chemotaxis protein